MGNQKMNQEAQKSLKTEVRFFYGYVIVALSFFVLIIAGGTSLIFGVFLKPLLKDFGWTRAATAGAFSVQAILAGFLGIVTGRLNDRFGPRVVLTGSGIFLGLGYLLMSQADRIWHIYLFYGVFIAMGMSCTFVPLISTVARWFVKKRGLMTGIAVVGAGIGVMIMPPTATWLISNYSWRTSYAVIGLMHLIVILFAAQFLRRDPGQMGLLPDGLKEIKREMEKENPHSEAGGFFLREAIRTRQFWLLCAAYMGFGLFLLSIMVHVIPHAIELGISPTTAASILTMIGGLSILGKISIGSISDKIGQRLAAVIGFILGTAALACLLAAKDLPMLYLFAAFFGLAYGGLMALQSPMVAGLFGLRSHGAILGTTTFCLAIGSAIGPALAGYIFDLTGSYRIAFLVCIAASIAGLISAAFLTPIQSFSSSRP